MRLEGVPDRVPEIEERANALLALVVAYDRDLRPNRGSDNRAKSVCVAGGQAREIVLEAREQRFVARERDLHDLGETRGSLARRQRGKVREIHHDTARLVECSDEVLSGGVIESRLAADGRV